MQPYLSTFSSSDRQLSFTLASSQSIALLNIFIVPINCSEQIKKLVFPMEEKSVYEVEKKISLKQIIKSIVQCTEDINLERDVPEDQQKVTFKQLQSYLKTSFRKLYYQYEVDGETKSSTSGLRLKTSTDSSLQMIINKYGALNYINITSDVDTILETMKSVCSPESDQKAKQMTPTGSNIERLNTMSSIPNSLSTQNESYLCSESNSDGFESQTDKSFNFHDSQEDFEAINFLNETVVEVKEVPTTTTQTTPQTDVRNFRNKFVGKALMMQRMEQQRMMMQINQQQKTKSSSTNGVCCLDKHIICSQTISQNKVQVVQPLPVPQKLVKPDASAAAAKSYYGKSNNYENQNCNNLQDKSKCKDKFKKRVSFIIDVVVPDNHHHHQASHQGLWQQSQKKNMWSAGAAKAKASGFLF